MYERPGGKLLTRVPARTEWGTPRVFGVIDREGDWLAVQAPELTNETIAWMRAEGARLDCVRWSLHADLSKRALDVRRDGHTERSFAIGIGRRGNPTPEGRFSVTDKLRVTDDDSPYGCCVIALTGHQTRLPASWPGGDRLAVHATHRPGEHWPLGDPRLHARADGRGALADRDDPGGRADLRLVLNLTPGLPGAFLWA